LSLITGVGRVSVGLTMARLFGMERQAAYRFVLLASIPVLWVRVIAESLQNADRGAHLGLSDVLAAVITFLLVTVTLPLAVALVRRSGLLPFALYRIVFGLVLIGLGML
jgi:undecaprenyl-diphosphatase